MELGGGSDRWDVQDPCPAAANGLAAAPRLENPGAGYGPGKGELQQKGDSEWQALGGDRRPTGGRA
jgi:hypothetical protein